MGSNGAAGAQAVKAVGGLCIAQDPESAEYPSMPRHLIDAGYADHVLHPAEMPDVLLTYAGSPYATGGREAAAGPVLDREGGHLREILAVLRTRARQDFNGYKKPTVLRRVQRRMGLMRVGSLAEYARLLRQTPAEITALADDLLIHVTGFFRDPDAWDALRRQVVEPLVARRGPGEAVRAWVAACSSGEEAYTLAMLLVEEGERVGKPLDVKVFATDLADRTLAHARAGVYPGGIESEISPERLERFFVREAEVWRVRADLRDRVVIAPQNILQDPPFSRLDIATCRNLLIYLEPEVQTRVLNLLHFGLREGGALFLGSSESVAGVEGLFEVLDKKARLFRRVGPTRHGAIDFPLPRTIVATESRMARAAVVTPAARPKPVGGLPVSVAELSRQALLDAHMPPAVTVDRDGQVVFYHGDTAPYLRMSGEPTRKLLLLTREGVRGAVRAALQRAAAENARVTVPDGWVDQDSGRRHRVGVTASPVPDPSAGDHPAAHFVVSFNDHGEVPAPGTGSPSDAADGWDAEVRRLRGELQGTIEELQTSNEELKASNEEVTSVNEELQSANEEMETGREEMQSLNEELSTVNAQLRAKMEEHQATSSDLGSLLTSTDIAVLFLDTAFRIRRFTPAARDLIDLIPGDIGRPLNALARKFDDPRLDADAGAVLERLVPAEREVGGAGGRHYLRRVTPYRTADNRIDGVVVTFVDVTPRKRAEDALRASEEQFRRAIEDAPIPVLMQAEDGQILQLSRTWTDLTGYTLADMPTAEAWLTRAYGPGADDVRAHTHELFRGARKSLNVDFTIRTRDGGERHWNFSASAPGTLGDGRRFLVGMAVDVTDRKRVEEALRDADRRKDEFLAMLAHELRNPLAPVRNGLQVIRMSPDRTVRDRSLEMMDRQLAHMVRLVDDLLDGSRIARGKLGVRRRHVTLADVVTSAVETARPAIDAAGHALDVSLPAEPVYLDADLTRLAQVFGNLLTNSAKYTPPGGRIALSADRQDGRVVVSVRDTGMGIPAGSLPHVFDMFSQVDQSLERPTGGLGIGLALVKGLVEMHGGTVTARSEGPGCGSTFTVTLPVIGARPAAAGLIPESPPSAAAAGRRVLVADDNRDGAESMAVMLGMLGHEVRTAHDGVEAVEEAGRFRPEVILMDLGMPRLSGLDATRQVRAQPWGRDMTIIALTGWGQDGDRKLSKEAGCDGHLVKPVSLADLGKMLATLAT
jgi:two-component system CheB/CheR fusion protein